MTPDPSKPTIERWAQDLVGGHQQRVKVILVNNACALVNAGETKLGLPENSLEEKLKLNDRTNKGQSNCPCVHFSFKSAGSDVLNLRWLTKQQFRGE